MPGLELLWTAATKAMLEAWTHTLLGSTPRTEGWRAKPRVQIPMMPLPPLATASQTWTAATQRWYPAHLLPLTAAPGSMSGDFASAPPAPPRRHHAAPVPLHCALLPPPLRMPCPPPSAAAPAPAAPQRRSNAPPALAALPPGAHGVQPRRGSLQPPPAHAPTCLHRPRRAFVPPHVSRSAPTAPSQHARLLPAPVAGRDGPAAAQHPAPPPNGTS
eukprot:366228-Chlamydomonas_euryale.AAC.25